MGGIWVGDCGHQAHMSLRGGEGTVGSCSDLPPPVDIGDGWEQTGVDWDRRER